MSETGTVNDTRHAGQRLQPAQTILIYIVKDRVGENGPICRERPATRNNMAAKEWHAS